MDFVNPNFKVNETNIFNIRQREYNKLEEEISLILEPVKDIGFDIIDFGIRDSKFSSGELHKTLKKNLVMKLQRGTSNIDISMQIPKLIDKNYIIINGRRKIPLFQLFDIPVVTRGKSIKIRTNVATLMLFETNESPYVYLSVLGKRVPFFLVMFGYYGYEALNQRFDFEHMSVEPNTLYGKVLYDLKEFYIGADGDYDDDQVIRSIGRIYSKYNFKTKGEILLYALDLMLQVDPSSAKLLKTDSLIEEFLDVIRTNSYDDTNYINKRIRCFEYMILSKVSKAIFDLCIANKSTRNAKFNVNSTQVLSDCNVSDIVQFDFSINPIEELTKLSRTSLVGPGGFKRENVPEHLRDISDSMFGRMCSVDTPDRDNCGVLQNLLVNTDLDSNLQFTEKTLTEAPISIPVSMIPFLEHDDQTRLQMASSQMRQSIMLKKFDVPKIQSGCEGLYTDYTQFIKRAKRDGEVVFMDDKFIIVVYDDKTIDIFNIAYRKIYVENMDLLNIYVKCGDKFKAGEILAESNYCTNGHINIGKNLLTAVMVYYGYNYEDGIVISDRLVNDGSFTSIHYKDLSFTLPPDKVLLSLKKDEYKPLPEVFDRLAVGEEYAIMKKMPTGVIDFCTLFEESVKLTTKKSVIISEVNIIPNQWNEDVPEFKDWVEEKITVQIKKENQLQGVIKKYLSKDAAIRFIRDNNLDKFSHTGKYKIKKERINGIHVEMFGIYTRKVTVGDKIGNRHGNKGVISTIVPHEMMPKLEDGRHVDICINPLGIISRMNIGQLFELHLSMALEDLKKNTIQMLRDGQKHDQIKSYLINFIKIIDNTKGGWYLKLFKEQLPKVIDEEFINNLTLIQPPFESVTAAMTEDALNYVGTKFEQKVFDPVSGRYIVNPIAVGYMYFFRMVHIAESRLAARGIGSYARRTLQPLAGRKNRGGQRCGEMETACLIGHDAPINLFEFLTTKSDCIDLKNKYIRETIETDLIKEEGDVSIVAESVKLLEGYLLAIGVDPR